MVIALHAAAAGMARASTDVLCVKRSGQVVGRPACKPRERFMEPGELGLVGPAGPPGALGAAGAPGGHPYTIRDANGRQFGHLLGLDFVRARVEVTLPDGTPVQFVVVPGGGFSQELHPTAYYEEPGCTGTPFVFGSTGLVPPVLVVGTIGYYSSAAPEPITIASQEYEPSPGSDCGTNVPTERGTCCWNTSAPAYGSRATTVPVATLGVTPPFEVQR